MLGIVPARMNSVIRCIDGQIARGDTFHINRRIDLVSDHLTVSLPDYVGLVLAA